jgi:hypothetical protein
VSLSPSPAISFTYTCVSLNFFSLCAPLGHVFVLIQHILKSHLADGRCGERLRDGIRTVIMGEPNVGKSSLLNVLCKYWREYIESPSACILWNFPLHCNLICKKPYYNTLKWFLLHIQPSVTGRNIITCWVVTFSCDLQLYFQFECSSHEALTVLSVTFCSSKVPWYTASRQTQHRFQIKTDDAIKNILLRWQHQSKSGHFRNWIKCMFTIK